MSVDCERHVRSREILLLVRIVDLDEQVAAAAVDDVLHLAPMEVIGRDLPFLDDQQLLGVGLHVLHLVIEVAVAEREHEEPDLLVVARTEVRDVPAEHVVADLVVVVSLRRPVRRTPVRERRQLKLHVLDKRDRVTHDGIEF